MEERLVITIVPHSRFGYLLTPVFAVYDPEIEVYAITETARAYSSTFDELTDCEREIVGLGGRYSDKSLMTSFSREDTESLFLQNVTDHNVKIHIRPFIEKKQEKMVRLIREASIPVFLRERVGICEFRAGTEIELLQEPSEMVFCFRNGETFTYHTEVKNGASTVPLYGEFFAPLVSYPLAAVIGRKLHYFEEVDENKLKPFFEKEMITVPDRSRSEYIRKFVVQCVKKYDVKAEGINVYSINYHPVAMLSLESDFKSRPVLHLRFRYGERFFAVDTPYRKEVEQAEENGVHSIGWFFRDEEWERGMVHKLIAGGLTQSRTGKFVTADGEAAPEEKKSGVVEWINRNAEILKNFELKQSFGKFLYYVGEIGMRISAEESVDWFDMRCMVSFGEIEIPFIKFKNHILNNIREYLLPDGRIAILPSQWFARFGEMFRYGRTEGDAVRLHPFHYRIKQLAQNGFIPEEKPEETGLPVEVPAALKTTLRPYQLNGFRWMAGLQRNGFGGCLADDMGLGKTVQAIAMLLYAYRGVPNGRQLAMKAPRQLSLFEEESLFEKASDFEKESAFKKVNTGDEGTEPGFINPELPPTLVVMPSSLVHNWRNEFSTFAPLLNVYLHTGSDRFQYAAFEEAMHRHQIILTSYAIVRQDIDFLNRYHFHYLILDESQYIKNRDSQIFDCVKMLHSTFKLALTGTPMENSLSDLWSQMDFLNEGILGKYTDFKTRYRESEMIYSEEDRSVLLQIINPFILRRTKEEVAPELPPLTEEVVFCEMEEAQAALYASAKNKIRNALSEKMTQGETSISVDALSSLTQLRLLAGHPVISDPAYQGGSAKFEQIIMQAEMLFACQHKVLIFSSFVEQLKLLAGFLTERNRKYAWLTGSTKDREGEIEKFNSDESVQVFLISLKAGGTGLNLTAADYVFIMDPWWNPASEMQAASRAHRIGQNKKVTLYRFITKDTVEEKIQQLQRYKKALTDTVINRQLSMREIEALLD